MKKQFLMPHWMLIAFWLCIPLWSNAQISKAQTWFPIGAKWYYGILESPLNGPMQGLLVSEVSEDTMIHSKKFSHIESTKKNSHGSIINQSSEYLYEESGIVFHLIGETFDTLYNFNAKAGESWQTRVPDFDPLKGYTNTWQKILVDSVSRFIINTDTLKALYVRSKDANNQTAMWSFRNPIIEGIGAEYLYLKPWIIMDADIPRLRCYISSNLSYKAVEKLPCDTFITEPNELFHIDGEQSIKIFPNPVTNLLNISCVVKSLNLYKLTIFNGKGQCLRSSLIKKDENTKQIIIETENLIPGIYSLNLYFKHTNTTVIKNLHFIKL